MEKRKYLPSASGATKSDSSYAVMGSSGQLTKRPQTSHGDPHCSTGLAPTTASGYNVYSRPTRHPHGHRASIGNPEGVAMLGVPSSSSQQRGSEQSSPGSSGHSPSRRSSLFSSFRRSSKSPGKSSSKGSGGFFNMSGAGTRRASMGKDALDFLQQEQSRPLADDPGRGKTGGGFWESFRPRSKSDSRNSHRSRLSGLAAALKQNPMRMDTVSTIDEHRSSDGHAITSPPDQLLHVDTDLANCVVSPRGSASDHGVNTGQLIVGSAMSASISKKKGSWAQGVDRILADHLRRRSYSSPYNTGAHYIRRRSEGPIADFTKLNVSPGSSGNHLSPFAASQLRVMPKHSLDTFLGGAGAGGGPTAIIYKTESQQFFIGNDLTALAVSTLENENLVYTEFMRVHKCYDLIPTSTKLVVFDTQLLVKKAFFALVYNSVRAAPLWDSKAQQFIGMLTISDFISVLLRRYNTDSSILDVEENRIAAWKDPVPGNNRPTFYSIDVNDSLFDAVKLLCEKKVHRLPVTNAETGNVLYILTHKRLLKFLYLYMNDLPKPKWMQNTPQELEIGTWRDIVTIHPDTKLIDVLKIFSQHRVSALPIVDQNGVLVDIYAKFDVINIAAEKAYNDLDIPVTDALKHRMDWYEGVRHCDETDSLWAVVEELVKQEVHRMVITDSSKRVKGIVSLSDLLTFLVMKHANDQADEMEHRSSCVDDPDIDYTEKFI